MKRCGWLTGLCLALLLGLAGAARAAPAVRVGINASYAPFETVDDRGRLSGFDIDLVNAWSQQQKVPVKFVNLAWPQLLDALAEGRVDMVVSAVAVTPARRARFAFSRPYYYEPQVLLLPADGRQEDPRRLSSIGVLAGSSAEGWLARLGVRSGALERYDGLPPMMADLRAGRIDAAFGDAHALRRAAVGGLRLVSRPQFGQDAYAFVLRKNDRALLARADAGIAALLADGTVERLRHRYPGL